MLVSEATEEAIWSSCVQGEPNCLHTERHHGDIARDSLGDAVGEEEAEGSVRHGERGHIFGAFTGVGDGPEDLDRYALEHVFCHDFWEGVSECDQSWEEAVLYLL